MGIKSLFFCLTSCFALGCHSKNIELKLHRPIDHAPSKFIEKFELIAQPYRYPGSGSDMHWWTWGIDGNGYVIDDDGKNFDGPDWYAHLLKVTGVPPKHKVVTTNDFQFYDFRQHIPNNFLRRYVCGIVSVDSSLYVCIYDYDWNIPSKSIHPDTLHRRTREYNPWHDLDSALGYNMGFIDAYSRNGGVAGIIVSKDFGVTWSNLPDEQTPQFFHQNSERLHF